MEKLNYEEELKKLYDVAVEEKDVVVALDILELRKSACEEKSKLATEDVS